MIRSGLGEAAAAHLHELAWGRDPREVVAEQVEKSISAETTFDTDVDDPGCSGARCWPWRAGDIRLRQAGRPAGPCRSRSGWRTSGR